MYMYTQIAFDTNFFGDEMRGHGIACNIVTATVSRRKERKRENNMNRKSGLLNKSTVYVFVYMCVCSSVKMHMTMLRKI